MLMKKIYFKSLSIIMSFALFCSCTNNDFDDTSVKTSTDDENFFIPENEAVDIAKDAVSELDGVQTRNGGKQILRVASVYYTGNHTRTANDKGDNFFYIINFEGGGFAIVPSDKRATSVYAMSDEGSFEVGNNNGSALFLELAESYLADEIALKDTIIAIKPNDNGFQKGPTDSDDPRIYAIVYMNGQYCHDMVKETKTSPFYMLETTWGQGIRPYNSECFTNNGEQAVTGCVPVALGQIMAYHKQPQTYNEHIYYWDKMPTDYASYDYSQEAYSVAYLLHDIGITSSTKYGVNASSTNYKNASSTLVKFGYVSDGFNNYNVSDVISSLKNDLPVYMRGKDCNSGDGHAWVVDGYYSIIKNHTYYTVDELKIVGRNTETKHYLHMNWGWYGQGNGYYLSNAFTPLSYDFSADLKNICNIRYAN